MAEQHRNRSDGGTAAQAKSDGEDPSISGERDARAPELAIRPSSSEFEQRDGAKDSGRLLLGIGERALELSAPAHDADGKAAAPTG